MFHKHIVGVFFYSISTGSHEIVLSDSRKTFNSFSHASAAKFI